MFFHAIFSSKIVQFLLHPIVGMFSCHFLPVVDRIFFRCFGKTCFACIILPFVIIIIIIIIHSLELFTLALADGF